MSIRERAGHLAYPGKLERATRRSNTRVEKRARDRKRRERSPELAEDGVEALDDFMRSNRFNAIQGND